MHFEQEVRRKTEKKRRMMNTKKEKQIRGIVWCLRKCKELSKITEN